MINETKQIISLDDVPDHVNGASLNSFQKEKFARGEQVYLENMQVRDGRIVDGKVKLVRDGEELKVELFEKKPVLEIPETIMGYRLSEKEKEDLLAERVVAIRPVKGNTLFVQVDKELNRVMVRTEKDLSMIREIGGYKLSDADKLKWANAEKLPIKIFYDEKTKMYFAASIRKTPDGKGIEYNDYKSLKDASPEKIREMIGTFNKPQDHLTAAVSVTGTALTPKEKSNTLITLNDFKHEKKQRKPAQAPARDNRDKGVQL